MDFNVCILSFQWERIEDATSSGKKGIEYSVTLKERVSNNKPVVACDLAMLKEKVALFHRIRFSPFSHKSPTFCLLYYFTIHFKKPFKGS